MFSWSTPSRGCSERSADRVVTSLSIAHVRQAHRSHQAGRTGRPRRGSSNAPALAIEGELLRAFAFPRRGRPVRPAQIPSYRAIGHSLMVVCMNPPARMSGVFAPVITPFKPDLSPDSDRLIRHCRWLLANDVGLAVFGTNSEGNSLSVDERIALLDDLDRRRPRPRPHDARHRLLRLHRHRPPHRTRREARLRRCPHAPALLLQERERRGPLPHLSPRSSSASATLGSASSSITSPSFPWCRSRSA